MASLYVSLVGEYLVSSLYYWLGNDKHGVEINLLIESNDIDIVVTKILLPWGDLWDDHKNDSIFVKSAEGYLKEFQLVEGSFSDSTLRRILRHNQLSLRFIQANFVNVLY